MALRIPVVVGVWQPRYVGFLVIVGVCHVIDGMRSST